MLPLLYCVVTVIEFVQGPLSAIFSRAQCGGIDYVHAVTTGAARGTRTPTGLRPPAPQAGASTIPPPPQSVPHSNTQVGKRGEALLARFPSSPGGTRTHTSFRTLDFESSGSTNSPTEPYILYLLSLFSTNQYGSEYLSDNTVDFGLTDPAVHVSVVVTNEEGLAIPD